MDRALHIEALIGGTTRFRARYSILNLKERFFKMEEVSELISVNVSKYLVQHKLTVGYLSFLSLLSSFTTIIPIFLLCVLIFNDKRLLKEHNVCYTIFATLLP